MDTSIIFMRLYHKIFDKSILTPLEPISTKKVKIVWHTCKDLKVINETDFHQVIKFENHKKHNYSEIRNANCFKFSGHFEIIILHIIFGDVRQLFIEKHLILSKKCECAKFTFFNQIFSSF